MLIPADKQPVFVELKSKSGYLSERQREVRQELLRVGCAYFVAMTAHGAMTAIVASRIVLRRPWRDPAPPHTDTFRIPRAAAVLKQRREERWRARSRQRARAVEAARGDGAGASAASEQVTT
jgi:hypothetical protein